MYAIRSYYVSAYSRCMSSIVSIATPQRPTSPTLSGSSESRPISVGRSNATDSPVWPLPRLVRYNSLEAFAVV